MTADATDTFWGLIDDIRTCMMTTRDGSVLRSRPMMPDIDRTSHEFRFVTRRSTHKTDELAANPDVNLAFADPGKGEFVSVSGQAYLTDDRHLIDKLWNDVAEAYFACGKDDPDIGVIRVVPTTAEYWDSHGTLRQVFNLFKAKHGDAGPDLGDNRKLAL